MYVLLSSKFNLCVAVKVEVLSVVPLVPFTSKGDEPITFVPNASVAIFIVVYLGASPEYLKANDACPFSPASTVMKLADKKSDIPAKNR